MALIGDFNTEFEVISTYHIISSFNWGKFGKICITVSSYKDENSRIASARPLAVRVYYLDNIPVENNPSLIYLYNQLKLNSDFIGMIDA